jgi:hypothetical protein
MKRLTFRTLSLLSLLVAASAFADPTPNPTHSPSKPINGVSPTADQSLPEISGIRGGVSTESAVKETQSDIEDWTDEHNQMNHLVKSECRDAKILQALLPRSWFPIGPTGTSGRLPKYFTEVESGKSAIASDVENLRSLADEAFAGVPITGAEKQQLQVIQSHALESLLDRYDALISLQKLSMSVANRIFSYDIETYRQMAEVASKPDAVVNRCQEETLRIQRDVEMITAANELISLYSDYDDESTRELQNAVNQPDPQHKLN